MEDFVTALIVLAVLALPIAFVYVLYKKSQAEAKLNWFCPSCESFAQGVKKTCRGSGWVEFALWLCFIAPGFIYSVWRSAAKDRACPHCKARPMIPADSPKAKRAALAAGAS